ncbi:MAG: sigma-70 family RNA polymerase sigma factor [Candidatus Pacebacteria bacterium]|nr:sigma-70 family RNA polymerase sigma factor [Candidatus Paceibacterota bacterium]
MEINETKLIYDCQKGQLESFAPLYDKYIGKIYAFLFSRSGSKELSEDLCSQTFLKALRSISQFKAEDNYFSAWLYKIARNNLIDHYRQSKDTLDIDSVWSLASDQKIEEEADKDLKLEKVKKYLSVLDTEQREIVVLKVWDELSYQEISEIMGKSVNNCKVIFSRSLKKLKQEMPLSLFILFLLNL